MEEAVLDLLIIGGGIMGLMTAYFASLFTRKITLLEKSVIGPANTQAASFSYTRSIRNDYLDPQYARLAYESRMLWKQIEKQTGQSFIIDCGCLNIAKTSITPHLAQTYAEQSYQTMLNLHLHTTAFEREALQQRFPQFDADLGRLDVEAGFIYVPSVTQTILAALQERGVQIEEELVVQAIDTENDRLRVRTNRGEYLTNRLVICAGLGTNDLLRQISGNTLTFPLKPDRPSQCKYFIPPPQKRSLFTADRLPVFAYLDVGIYGHPIYEQQTPGVKIGFYNPPDVQTQETSIHDVHSFVAECMPELQDAETIDVRDADQCFYDLVEDDNFILGALPNFPRIYVGVGWRGTGYKYAPWIGQTLTQLTLQEGTVYDIARFTPQRFVNHRQ